MPSSSYAVSLLRVTLLICWSRPIRGLGLTIMRPNGYNLSYLNENTDHQKRLSDKSNINDVPNLYSAANVFCNYSTRAFVALFFISKNFDNQSMSISTMMKKTMMVPMWVGCCTQAQSKLSRIVSKSPVNAR